MKAVVQDGSTFRIYDDADRPGDVDHIVETVTAPVRCRNPAERREWFKQTLLARSLGDYEMMGD